MQKMEGQVILQESKREQNQTHFLNKFFLIIINPPLG